MPLLSLATLGVLFYSGLTETLLGLAVLSLAALVAGIVGIIADGYTDKVELGLAKTFEDVMELQTELASWGLALAGFGGLVYALYQLLG